MIVGSIDIVAIIIVVAVAAAESVSDGATAEYHLRCAADGTADVAAAIDIGGVRAALNEDEAVVGHTVHLAAAIDGARNGARAILFHVGAGTGIFVAQVHQAAYGIAGIAAGGGERFAAGHSTCVAAAIDSVRLTI